MHGDVVCFAHGKESGPWGTKIRALATVARSRGYRVESPDCSDLSDPDLRVERLFSVCTGNRGRVVLVGSSMGAYAATVASERLKPTGLFLMAPAFYLPGYAVQDPTPHAGKIVVVHGWDDSIVPAENAIRFAGRHHAILHVLRSDHRLEDQIPFLQNIFGYFLDSLTLVAGTGRDR